MAESYSTHQRSFIHSWAFRVPLIIILILLLLWGVTEIAGPPIAEAVVKKMIRDRYPQATDPSVSIRAFPALKLAFKDYDKLTIVVNSITLQGVDFDRIELTSYDWPAGSFRGVIRQDEIERFFTLQHSYVIDPKLEIQNDSVVVSGKVSVSGLLVSVKAVGALVPLDGRRIYFEPQSVQVAGVPIPSQGVTLVRQVMKENPVFTVREDLPYTITQIFVEQGKMVIKGNVNMEKALNIQL
jgi:hypothetical protein